jgi:hypothetical protein
VLIDHGITGMSAEELVEAIRFDWPVLPIIFATPLASAGLQKMPKPFGRDDLLQAIGNARSTPSTQLSN